MFLRGIFPPKLLTKASVELPFLSAVSCRAAEKACIITLTININEHRHHHHLACTITIRIINPSQFPPPQK
jgi:hypothetical protein